MGVISPAFVRKTRRSGVPGQARTFSVYTCDLLDHCPAKDILYDMRWNSQALSDLGRSLRERNTPDVPFQLEKLSFRSLAALPCLVLLSSSMSRAGLRAC